MLARGLFFKIFFKKMNYELLILFNSSLPSWDEECFYLAGENPEGIGGLVSSGYLKKFQGAYVLTPEGVREREKISKELFIPVTPAGEIITDSSQALALLELNRMVQLIDKAFVTDWGIKETTVRENFPVMPCLKDSEYFKFESEKIIAAWPEHENIKKFLAAFPHWGVVARKFPVPGQEALDEFARKNNFSYGNLIVDFVLRSRADFNHYKNYQQLPSDKFKFLDSDQLFVKKVPASGRLEDLLPFIGKLHIFLLEQRRIFLPGFFDIDHDENEDWHLLALVTDNEEQLENLTRTLRTWGNDLINPANPLYIIGTSIERLRNQREQKRTIYDWFDEETVRILRPDV